MFSSSCPFCRIEEESIDHIFFTCVVAARLWSWLVEWSVIMQSQPSCCPDLLELQNQKTSDKRIKKLKMSLIYSTLWVIWKARNALVYRNERQVVMFMAV